MTTPDDPAHGSANRPRANGPDDEVSLAKGGSGSAEESFDPYRFGKPDRPVPPEYAPPGYVPDTPPATPPPGSYPSTPYGQQPYQAYGQSSQQAGQQPYGQQSYGQQPYGQYPPAPYAGRPQGGNGKATTAMVLGIVAIVLCWLSFFDLLLIIPALVFGILGLSEAKNRGGTGRGPAIAGIACAVVAALLATLLTVFIFRAADKCGGFENSDDPSFSNCVSDNFLK